MPRINLPATTMIIGLGETVYDIIFKDNQPVKAVPGGSAFNAMVSLGRSGAECLMATEVGDDHIGDMVVKFLADNGVSADYVYRHEGTKSHVSLAFLDKRNDAQYLFYKDHRSLCLPDRIPAMAKGDIVLFGSFFAINPTIRDYTRRFLLTARDSGAILYYDINFRASHKDEIPDVIGNIEENMRLATVVRGSAEDFAILYGTATSEDAYERVRGFCDTFIYTDAANPIQVYTSGVKRTFPVMPIETVSTIGAGDNFNAGFCYAMYREGVMDADSIGSLPDDVINSFVASGQKFAAEVCQSMENYIT